MFLNYTSTNPIMLFAYSNQAGLFVVIFFIPCLVKGMNFEGTYSGFYSYQ